MDDMLVGFEERLIELGISTEVRAGWKVLPGPSGAARDDAGQSLGCRGG